MDTTAVLVDGYERVSGEVHDALDGIDPRHLNTRLDEGANSVAWLIWHLTRVQDDHIADAAGLEQVWHAEGWRDRFGLALPPDATGFGHGPEQVAAVRVDDPDLLLGYFDDVHAQTLTFVRGLEDRTLDRIIDDAWDPPVSLGVRLVSVLADDLQHVGQAAFLRGVLERG
ncbi:MULTISPECIES: mycothiol transferase [Streptomyces]|uniref:DinB-like domain-containing protein n=1 Tax=Streptomyces cacaoi TaxID=1898 RepID=A0A4Y3R6H0_STRCI|nr:MULTISPECIES: DinB family protein [Streptomyces]NNG87640.1 DinB family protein [Streptomyces cacaoi]QHF98059.1 DinB family protein [Streptomyces sp. NHF165]GEB53172.1 hypothetical protein SCA03_57230 [Streptomyces cacaoi]